MEESRVSDPLPLCFGAETMVEGTEWSSKKDATAASKVEVWDTSETILGHLRHSERRESESEFAAGTAEEKFCRLEVEAALAAAFSGESCETPRSSECNTGATAGDSTAPSYSDADTLTDNEVAPGSGGEKCCRLETEEAYSAAMSSEASGATAGDSTVPSCSDTEAEPEPDLADQPHDSCPRRRCRLQVEQALSLAVFSETCESLSRSAETRAAAAAAGDGSLRFLSDADEPPPFEATGEGRRQTEDPCEGWATDLSTMSSELEEGMWKEVRYGKRRPLQAAKPATKRLPRVALVALFDAVDAFIGESGPAPAAGATGGARVQGRGAPSFATSRRSAAGPRAAGPPEAHPAEDGPTEVEVWASKHLQATLEAIASRLENVERCVQAYHSHTAEASLEALEEQRLLLLELEKKLAGVLSLQAARRPLVQARGELLTRRLLRLRDVLQTGEGGGGFTELDVQLALKGARRHLRTAQGAAAKLALLLAGAAAAGGEG